MEEPKDERTKEGKGDGQRRTHAERAQLLRDYKASGQTQAAFARRAGINVGTLRGWIYKRPARLSASQGQGRLAPVRIVNEPRSATLPIVPSRGAVTVRLPRGVEVELAVTLDLAGVAQLVRELTQSCSR